MYSKIFFILAVFFGLVNSSSAQVLIEEGKVRMAVAPGTTLTNTITVHNTTDSAVDVKAYWQDFSYKVPFDGTKDFLSAGSTERSLNGWVTFNPAFFQLQPFGQQKIDYAIKIPDNAQGGYYGVLFFETAGESPDERVGLKIVTRIGSLFFIETFNRSKSAVIGEMSGTEKGFKGDFTNRGNVILVPNGIFYCLDEQGMVVSRGEVAPFYLPWGQTATFEVVLPDELKAQNYTAVVTFDLDDGDSLVKEVDFKKDSSGKIQIVQTRD